VPFIVYETVEDVEKFRTYREKVEDHFDSYTLAEAFLNGLIDWDGNELCDYCGKDCRCGALDWF
jgi:hypothetical protein